MKQGLYQFPDGSKVYYTGTGTGKGTSRLFDISRRNWGQYRTQDFVFGATLLFAGNYHQVRKNFPELFV